MTHRRPRARRLGLLAAATMFGAVLCAYSAAVRADLSTTVRFDIAAQRLPSAVLQYSQQSGVQVTSPAELLSGRRSAGVKGLLQAQSALAQLLAGTGLEFDVVDRTTVSIHAGAVSAPRDEITRTPAEERAIRVAQRAITRSSWPEMVTGS